VGDSDGGVSTVGFKTYIASRPMGRDIEQRFCRWLVQSADRAGGDKIGLTQEVLAEMLGARRTSVTEIASKIQAQGLISYSRGLIAISD
jgi:CRP-like cAMP-binding protein